MIEKTCRCGKTKKNFKIDIGPFFINDCCIEAGYNHLGELTKPKNLGLTKEEIEAINNGTLTGSLEIEDEGEQPDPSEELSEAESQDKEPEQNVEEPKVTGIIAKIKRTYNRNGNIKKNEPAS